MATLRIDYEPKNQLAILLAGEGVTWIQWSAIRRLCEENCVEVENIGSSSLMLPWWRFLSFRDGLKFVLQTQKISTLDVSTIAQSLLIKAGEQDKKYRGTIGPSIKWTEDKVQTKLRSLGFNRELKPYQMRNLLQIVNHYASATFSVPGSGKTTEALAFFFLTSDPNDRLFVIGPKNAFASWEDELSKCVPDCNFSFKRLTSGYKNIQNTLENTPKAVIISYHQLPRAMDLIVKFLALNPTYIFVDESHRMKRGADGVHGISVLRLSHLAKYKLLLTGTPMPNSKLDLVSQFNFLYPEVHSNEENIIELISSVFVRTTKAELGLPEPIRIRHIVEMNPMQRQLYDLLRSDAARHIAGFSANDRMQLRRFARCVQYMLQATSNPSLLVDSPIASLDIFNEVIREGLAPKLRETCRLVRGWVKEGKKILVWSFFVNTVEHLAGLLADLGAEYIHGGVNVSDDDDIWDSREAKIKRFKDPQSSCKVLIANPAACAESISLHQICHHAIYVDRNYNAAQYLQSEDRIHRIGLDPSLNTFITVLYTPNSIDDSVDRRLQVKVSSMRTVLNDPGLNINPIDLDDDSDGIDLGDLEDLRHLLLGQN